LFFSLDEFVKSKKTPVFVIPAKAGIQENHPAQRDWAPAFAEVPALEIFCEVIIT